MKSIVCIVLLLLTTLAGAAFADSAGRSRIISGDTLEIDGQLIRLFGIDAPKEEQTCNRNGTAWRCGEHAAVALAGLLGRHWITCVQHDQESYRHIVAICYLDQLDVNGWMVQQGWALDDVQQSKGRYASEEAEARTWRRGIWDAKLDKASDWRQPEPATTQFRPSKDAGTQYPRFGE